jgi:hypothetical protein
MASIRIQPLPFDEHQFVPAVKPSTWLDTSSNANERSIGELRLPPVDNGRYEQKHPILDRDGTTVGYLVNGASDIGYTWDRVYAGGCFWLVNMTFGATFNGGGSSVTLVEEVGTFLFSANRKFKATQSFGFKSSWAGATKVYKLLNEGRHLFYLTDYGFCLFDTYYRHIVTKIDFDAFSLGYNSDTDFALSPKVNLLAIAVSTHGEKDPLDGEYRYRNFVRLYDLDSGEVMGEHLLEINTYNKWSIDFSEDGRVLRLSSGSAYTYLALSSV